jgi:hypothetical protein
MSVKKPYRWLLSFLVIILLASWTLIGCSTEDTRITEEVSEIEEPGQIQPDDEMVLSMYVAYGGPDIIAE